MCQSTLTGWPWPQAPVLLITVTVKILNKINDLKGKNQRVSDGLEVCAPLIHTGKKISLDETI